MTHDKANKYERPHAKRSGGVMTRSKKENTKQAQGGVVRLTAIHFSWPSRELMTPWSAGECGVLVYCLVAVTNKSGCLPVHNLHTKSKIKPPRTAKKWITPLYTWDAIISHPDLVQVFCRRTRHYVPLVVVDKSTASVVTRNPILKRVNTVRLCS